MGPACGDSLPALIVAISGGHSETSWGRMQEACIAATDLRATALFTGVEGICQWCV